MTQDEIIEMAREAGLATTYGGYRDWVEAGPRKHSLVAFAKLVREDEREASKKVLINIDMTIIAAMLPTKLQRPSE